MPKKIIAITTAATAPSLAATPPLGSQAAPPSISPIELYALTKNSERDAARAILLASAEAMAAGDMAERARGKRNV